MKRQQIDNGPTKILVLGAVTLGFVTTTIISGCNRTEIHSYHVAKEQTTNAPATRAQQTESNHTLVDWAIPTAWIEVDTTSSMRIATFNAQNAQEIAVTAFPGDVGGLVANVNRWRGQVGLDPSDEVEINQSIDRLEDSNVIIVDILGEQTRLIGSIIDIGDGQTWFVKAMGSSDSVEQIKAELIEFSKSFKIHSHDHDHAADAPTPSAQTTAQTVWEQPEQWSIKENASSMLAAAFMADSGARITLTVLVGDGGGALSNINCWRGQLGLGVLPSMADQQFKDLGNGALIVDIVASDESGRMVAGIVPVQGRTLFFKLTGTPTQIDTELERFEAYIHTEGLGKVATP